MAHPLELDGAVSRVRRTNRYIEEADSLLNTFASECEDSIIKSYHTHTSVQFPRIPDDLPFALSDAIHNLRAALDYAVYELALKDSGSIQEGTQFPLEHCKSGQSPHGNQVGFDSIVGRYLKGIKPEHVAIIERFQPYNGRDWALDLRDISNPDKHRRPTLFYREDTISAWVHPPGSEGKPFADGRTIKADPTHTIFIELPDRKLWVLNTIWNIQSGVTDTLNALAPAFK